MVFVPACRGWRLGIKVCFIYRGTPTKESLPKRQENCRTRYKLDNYDSSTSYKQLDVTKRRMGKQSVGQLPLRDRHRE